MERVSVFEGKGGRQTKLRSSSPWKACSSAKRFPATTVTDAGKVVLAAAATAGSDAVPHSLAMFSVCARCISRKVSAG